MAGRRPVVPNNNTSHVLECQDSINTSSLPMYNLFRVGGTFHRIVPNSRKEVLLSNVEHDKTLLVPDVLSEI